MFEIVRAENLTEQFLKEIQILVRRTVAAKSAGVLFRFAEFLRDQVERFIPGRGFQFSVSANQRLSQAVLRGCIVMREASLVAQPNFVDCRILAWHDAFDFMVALANERVASN